MHVFPVHLRELMVQLSSTHCLHTVLFWNDTHGEFVKLISVDLHPEPQLHTQSWFTISITSKSCYLVDGACMGLLSWFILRHSAELKQSVLYKPLFFSHRPHYRTNGQICVGKVIVGD